MKFTVDEYGDVLHSELLMHASYSFSYIFWVGNLTESLFNQSSVDSMYKENLWEQLHIDVDAWNDFYNDSFWAEDFLISLIIQYGWVSEWF